MEEGPESSSTFDDSIDIDDLKYLGGLSTILVANIQELNDRICQIEFIFSKQLFPGYKSRSKCLQKQLLEAKKTANGEWKKRESSLLDQIKELRLEKQCAQEEVQRLNILLEEAKTKLTNAEELVSKYEPEKIQLLTKVENLERYGETIANLKEQLSQKSDELGQGRKLQEKLLQQIDIKGHSLLVEQSKRKCLFEEFSKFKDSYKHLKSQYNFLLSKIGDSKENKPHADRMEEEKDSPKSFPEKEKSPRRIQVKVEDVDLQKKLVRDQDSTFAKPSHGKTLLSPSSTSTSLPSKHVPANTKSGHSIGLKRSASSCRETRARQDLPILAPNDMDFNNSDDETQKAVPQK